ncbi:NAD-dependent epimerase/dehydratase family protein [Nocardioides sp. SYSU D00038]|uniref:NAD-dependent epimerase/dehydratase family protein n=1 Tax=Nocardioides sp. SYSU D00038 TaxID=2812554 RepID=UPI001967FE12|nr:NAD-dependent epimerase/dehydratase family protein [Nocardioides sp. SYSU D00038]
MRILVLGGTVFLSREVAAEAVRRGHEVVCASRGRSGRVPDGARPVTWDREQDVPDELAAIAFDAVVDVARHPGQVARAVAAFPTAHWVFVSTVNVYADDATPGGRPGTLPLREARREDVDLAVEPEAYGPMKVACEEVVREGAASAMVLRPGLIVGPGDPSGRFAYWPRRLAAGGEVLAPGDPADVVQVVDVRDLAAWAVTACEERLAGDFDGVGLAMPIRELLEEAAAGVPAEVAWTWVDQEFLAEHEVQPWAGPDSLPLWLPRPAYDGMCAHDALPSIEAGLALRPIAETARDTLAWLEADPDAPVGGIGLERERSLLEAWGSRAT